MQWLIKKIVGTKNSRDIKEIQPLVDRINLLEEELTSLTDEQLQAKTDEFRERLKAGETLDDILPEAYAVVKNACRRLVGHTFDVRGSEKTWVEVPYDVQLIGGIAMHRMRIAEMATGEGKTLVAIMPVYLNALAGRGVHVVTVNDYLAQRDAEWMGYLYRWLGLTVGVVHNGVQPGTQLRREQYNCDITYGTNSEFGFDYLRDNMVFQPEAKVQRDYFFAIIDEIDSVLIDEAKTPLIISGPVPNSDVEVYNLTKPSVERLYRRQQTLCNDFMREAEHCLENGKDDEARQKLYQVLQGMPKHPGLAKVQEDASVRRMIEKVSLQMMSDAYKDQARELREELFFTIDEKQHDASLTDKGCAAMSPDDPDMYLLPDIAESMAMLEGEEGLSDEERHSRTQAIQEEFGRKSEIIHVVNQLIKAYCLYENNVEYVVEGNDVHIVDENTGRKMVGRRWSDGLHQAVEAKEQVRVQEETQTLATVTIQNYFRMYEKLAGMTGTAETEADEFAEIYKLDVLVIPTNRPVRRVDQNDLVYRTEREKFAAVVEEIREAQARKQPVLAGTASVDTSEKLSRLLDKARIPHNVLNAKQHEREAEIVTRAGQPGAVTIATNMAGRGTDIKLGEGVVSIDREVLNGQTSLDDPFEGTTLGKFLMEHPQGLYVVGTERHESRRIDRQLRGRCSRQGDPGSSVFYVSLEDKLMRLFGSDKISGIMEKLGIEEGEVLEHPWLNKSIERAQRKVEQQNFSIRKRTLEYDDVMNKQREVVYGLRSEVLTSETPGDALVEMLEKAVEGKVEEWVVDSEGGLAGLVDWLNMTFPVGIKSEELKEAWPDVEAVTDIAFGRVEKAYELKSEGEDPEGLTHLERYIVLGTIDEHWQEFLRNMDSLRQGIGLMGYGQRDPLVEFKREAYGMFADLMERIHTEVSLKAFRMHTSPEAMSRFANALGRVQTVHQDVQALGGEVAQAPRARQPVRTNAEAAVDEALEAVDRKPVRREFPKVGRNDPCPCGSGKKYKKCHGANG